MNYENFSDLCKCLDRRGKNQIFLMAFRILHSHVSNEKVFYILENCVPGAFQRLIQLSFLLDSHFFQRSCRIHISVYKESFSENAYRAFQEQISYSHNLTISPSNDLKFKQQVWIFIRVPRQERFNTRPSL